MAHSNHHCHPHTSNSGHRKQCRTHLNFFFGPVQPLVIKQNSQNPSNLSRWTQFFFRDFEGSKFEKRISSFLFRRNVGKTQPGSDLVEVPGRTIGQPVANRLLLQYCPRPWTSHIVQGAESGVNWRVGRFRYSLRRNAGRLDNGESCCDSAVQDPQTAETGTTQRGCSSDVCCAWPLHPRSDGQAIIFHEVVSGSGCTTPCSGAAAYCIGLHQHVRPTLCSHVHPEEHRLGLYDPSLVPSYSWE